MKTETKHTPGPWKVLPNSIEILGRNDEEVGQVNPGIVRGRQRSQIAAANARLIAAAPEMLAALEHVELGVFGSMLPGSDIEICTRSARLSVQSAISKAKGNQ